jgi:hypothetical protein
VLLVMMLLGDGVRFQILMTLEIISIWCMVEPSLEVDGDVSIHQG